jgi:hypothetical protein
MIAKRSERSGRARGGSRRLAAGGYPPQAPCGARRPRCPDEVVLSREGKRRHPLALHDQAGTSARCSPTRARRSHDAPPPADARRDPAARVTRSELPTFAEHLPVTQTAIGFAVHSHRNQRRVSDGAQVIVHPLEVAHCSTNAGCCDRIVAAGVLGARRSRATVEIVEEMFGLTAARVEYGERQGAWWKRFVPGWRA